MQGRYPSHREDITSHTALKDGFQIIADETCETCIPSLSVEEGEKEYWVEAAFSPIMYSPRYVTLRSYWKWQR
jgi:hypothetical protein